MWLLVSIQVWPLNTGKNNKDSLDKHGTAKGWPRPLNRGHRLIQVANIKFVWAKIPDYRGPGIEGGRLRQGRYIQVRLY